MGQRWIRHELRLSSERREGEPLQKECAVLCSL